MAKNLLQDMVKVKKIPIKVIVDRKVEKAKELPFRNEMGKIEKGGKKSKFRIYFVALISIIFLLFALSFLFSKAEVTITPKMEKITLTDENLSATKDSSSSNLSFDLVVISGEESKTIQGGEMKNVAVSATGTVMLYNAYSSSPQNLDIDTRLEGSNGKIYKTNKKTIIPGMTKDGKPGSVEVGIYGAGTGVSYNSAPLDFKIFGFKGTPKYSKFYGRGEGDITGGFEGETPVVSALDKTSAVSELGATLQADLLKKVTNQIPSGFILFKDATFLDTDNGQNVTFTPAENNNVLVDVKGTLYGFIFDEQKLTEKIAGDIVDKYDGSEVYMPNIEDLTFSLADKDNASYTDVKNIDFSLSGTPEIIWKVDEAKFTADILGKKKSDFNLILAQYPSIDTAQLILRPFWKTSFPDKSSSIQIIVNYPK